VLIKKRTQKIQKERFSELLGEKCELWGLYSCARKKRDKEKEETWTTATMGTGGAREEQYFSGDRLNTSR